MRIQSTSCPLSMQLQRLLVGTRLPAFPALGGPRAFSSLRRCDCRIQPDPRGSRSSTSADNTSSSLHKFSTLSYTPRHLISLPSSHQSSSSSCPRLQKAAHSTRSPSTPKAPANSTPSNEEETTMGSGMCLLLMRPQRFPRPPAPAYSALKYLYLPRTHTELLPMDQHLPLPIHGFSIPGSQGSRIATWLPQPSQLPARTLH